ncbi:hypothetical protein NGM37_27450 [Streptomyces sp. TRM76130]|nr:hypothetical protein [Streptomyces sp. TRM76130]
MQDDEAVTRAALRRIAGDPALPEAERTGAEGAVTEDTAEALAHLVDPFALVKEVPGVELQQAAWSSERFDYDPDSPDWGLDDDDGHLYDVYDDEDGADSDEGGADGDAGADGADGAGEGGGRAAVTADVPRK